MLFFEKHPCFGVKKRYFTLLLLLCYLLLSRHNLVINMLLFYHFSVTKNAENIEISTFFRKVKEITCFQKSDFKNHSKVLPSSNLQNT